MSKFLRACEAEDMLNARLQFEREREQQRQSYLSGNSLYRPRMIAAPIAQQTTPADNKPKLNRIS